MISFILNNRVVQWIVAGLGAVLAFLAYGKSQQRKGKKEVLREVREADNEKAAEIHNRVERDLPDRVREMDGRGYRD